jgi:hypothetical protein
MACMYPMQVRERREAWSADTGVFFCLFWRVKQSDVNIAMLWKQRREVKMLIRGAGGPSSKPR